MFSSQAWFSSTLSRNQTNSIKILLPQNSVSRLLECQFRERLCNIFPASSWGTGEAEVMSLSLLILVLLPIRVVQCSTALQEQRTGPWSNILQANFILIQSTLVYCISKVGTDTFIYHYFWIVILIVANTYIGPPHCHPGCQSFAHNHPVIFKTML